MTSTNTKESIDRDRSDLEQTRAFVLSGLGLAGPLLSGSQMAEFAVELGMIQIDSIRVNGLRNHEIAWIARSDAPAGEYYDLLYRRRALIETHYPLFAVRRDWLVYFRKDFDKAIRHGPWFRELRPLMRKLKKHIRDCGPVSCADFDSDRVPGGFNTIKATTKALEYLYYMGDLQIADRTQHFHRVFDLTERVVPELKEAPTVSRKELEAFCVRSAAKVLKLATPEQMARRTALHVGNWRGGGLPAARKAVDRALTTGTLIESSFAKTKAGQPYLMLKADAERPLKPLNDIVRIVPPLDNLLFSRERLAELFATSYKFEAYTPRHMRRFYFAMPVLHRDRVIGLIDAKKDEGTWRILGLELDRDTPSDEFRQAVHRLAAAAGTSAIACARNLPTIWRRTLDGPLDR